MQTDSNLDWQLWCFIIFKHNHHVCKTACTSPEVFNLTQWARTGSVSSAKTFTCVCVLKPHVQLQHYREVWVWLAFSLPWLLQLWFLYISAGFSAFLLIMFHCFFFPLFTSHFSSQKPPAFTFCGPSPYSQLRSSSSSQCETLSSQTNLVIAKLCIKPSGKRGSRKAHLLQSHSFMLFVNLGWLQKGISIQ